MFKETSLKMCKVYLKKKEQKHNSFSIHKNKSEDAIFLFFLFPLNFTWKHIYVDRQSLKRFWQFTVTIQLQVCFRIRTYKRIVYGIFLPAIHFLGHFYFVHNFLYTHIDQTNPAYTCHWTWTRQLPVIVCVVRIPTVTRVWQMFDNFSRSLLIFVKLGLIIT